MKLETSKTISRISNLDENTTNVLFIDSHENNENMRRIKRIKEKEINGQNFSWKSNTITLNCICVTDMGQNAMINKMICCDRQNRVPNNYYYFIQQYH